MDLIFYLNVFTSKSSPSYNGEIMSIVGKYSYLRSLPQVSPQFRDSARKSVRNHYDSIMLSSVSTGPMYSVTQQLIQVRIRRRSRSGLWATGSAVWLYFGVFSIIRSIVCAKCICILCSCEIDYACTVQLSFCRAICYCTDACCGTFEQCGC
jgi:hypothetical protein